MMQGNPVGDADAGKSVRVPVWKTARAMHKQNGKERITMGHAAYAKC